MGSGAAPKILETESVSEARSRLGGDLANIVWGPLRETRRARRRGGRGIEERRYRRGYLVAAAGSRVAK